MIIYMPTLALVNAIAFKQMASPEKEFSAIRVWGTIGWIASGLLIGWLALETTDSLDQTFKIAALVSLVLGVYSFMLPNTPPPKAGTKTSFSEIVGADAIGLLKDRNYLIFFMASLLICIPLAFYYQETNLFLNEVGVKNAASKMTMGQMSETIFLFLMPFFFSRLGVKKMLIRSSAQGMITLATYGAGMLVGFWLAGLIADQYKIANGHDWSAIWMVPAIIAAIILILFLLFFKDPSSHKSKE